MFYVIAKAFWVVAQPISVVLILVVAATIFASLKRKRLGIVAGALAAIILFVSCFTTLGAALIQPLEDRFSRPAIMPEDVRAIIVLGGSTKARVSTARGVA